MGTSHSKRKCPKRQLWQDDTNDVKEQICSRRISRDARHPMEMETKETERNCLPDAIVLESWTTASSSSSSVTLSSDQSLYTSSVEYRQQHPQRKPHPQSVECHRPCSCNLSAAAADSTDKNRSRMPFSCINAKGNTSSPDVSHASGDVSMENASKTLTTGESRIRDNEEPQGCGSRWRALSWIIDMCMDGRKKGSDKRMNSNNSSCSSSNGCKCNISGIGLKSSTLPDIRGKIDRRRRQCVDAKRAINGQADRPRSNCTSATGAADSWDAGGSLEEKRRCETHRHLLRQQTILGYDNKMLGDIIRINMIQNNVYIPSHSHSRYSDAFGRHSHCGRSRWPIKGGGGGGSLGCVGDGGGSGDGGGWRLEATVEEVTTNDEHQETETNIYLLQSTADDVEANDANYVGSSARHAKHVRRSSCASSGPNNDVSGPNNDVSGPKIRLRIVHRSNDSFDRRTTVDLPRRRNDTMLSADIANYFSSSVHNSRPEAVMSSCHYWHRHRHRERNQRRAMNRVADWIMREEENASQDVARDTKIISHYSKRHHHHHHFHNPNSRKNGHHRRHNWRHIMA